LLFTLQNSVPANLCALPAAVQTMPAALLQAVPAAV
jgi:hypothetical protein